MEEEVIGAGRSKAEAKRIVAKMILEQLSLRGYKVPAELAGFKAIHQLMDDAGLPTHSFVVLVNELCKQYRLDPVEYEVLADPAAGLNTYTVKARIGHVERVGTGPSKRVAQQLAAEQIYRHLRTRLSGTRNFNENEAMYRAYEKAMAPTSDEESPGEQRRREEEQQAAEARQKSRKKKRKKSMRRVDLDETVRMELDNSENGSHEVGPQPSSSAADEQAAAAEGAAAESTAAEGAAAEGGVAEGWVAAAAPNALEEDHDIAMRFILRTMARLGI